MLLSLSFSSIFADTYTHYEWNCITNNGNLISSSSTIGNEVNYNATKYYSNGCNGLPSNCVGKQTKQNYTMTIDNNGGSGGALKYNSDGSMYISNPSRTGYTFTSWSTSNNNAPASKIPASFAGNVTYTANWMANTYSVNYNSNGGSGSMSASTATYNQPFKTKQNSFSRTGYTFNGWNESANGSGVTWALNSSGVYESGKSWTWNYAKDITLYAQWNANTYTVNYNSNGGSGSMSSDTATYGQGYTTKANGFTKNGYTFAGWNEKADGTGTDWTGWIGKPWTWSYTNGVTLYAQWTPNTYTITYNANGGSGGPSTQNFKFNSGERISTSVPSRTGYDFVDWTYGGNHFKPGDAIPSGWGSFTLTAQWKQKLPTSFNLEAASGRLYNGPISVDLKKNQLYIGMFLGNKRPEGEEPQLSTNVNSGNSTILFSDYGSMNDNRRQTYIVFIPKSDFRASFKSSTDTQQSTFVLLKGNSEVPYSSYNSSDFSFGVSHNNSELSQVQNDKWGYGFVNISWYDTGAPWFDVQYSGSSFIDKSSSGDAGATVRVIGYNLQNKGIKIRGSASSSQYPVQNYGSLIIKKK